MPASRNQLRNEDVRILPKFVNYFSFADENLTLGRYCVINWLCIANKTTEQTKKYSYRNSVVNCENHTACIFLGLLTFNH
jgi:hypothetical protein